jgi:hypothetical protein
MSGQWFRAGWPGHAASVIDDGNDKGTGRTTGGRNFQKPGDLPLNVSGEWPLTDSDSAVSNAVRVCTVFVEESVNRQGGFRIGFAGDE